MFRGLGKCSRLNLRTWLWNTGRFWDILWLGSGDFEEIFLYWTNMLHGSAVSLALGIDQVTLGCGCFLNDGARDI